MCEGAQPTQIYYHIIIIIIYLFFWQNRLLKKVESGGFFLQSGWVRWPARFLMPDFLPFPGRSLPLPCTIPLLCNVTENKS